MSPTSTVLVLKGEADVREDRKVLALVGSLLCGLKMVILLKLDWKVLGRVPIRLNISRAGRSCKKESILLWIFYSLRVYVSEFSNCQ